MPVIRLECYVIACDSCGEVMENGDGSTYHYSTEQEAQGEVSDDDWVEYEGRIWCWREGCEPSCACGGTYKEHDYGDGPCDPKGACVEKCQDFRPLEEGGQ